MMKTLFLFLLSCGSLVAQLNISNPFYVATVTRNVASAASGATIPADIWMDFEFSATAGGVTTVKAEAQDHYAPTSITLVTDGASIMSTNTAAERATINNPQGTADSGISGLDVSLNSTTAGYIRWTLPSATNTVTMGTWIKTATITPGNVFMFAEIVDTGISSCSSAEWQNNAGTHRFRFLLGSSYYYINASVGTWYWVTVRHTEDGSCDAAVFDTSGAQIAGSPQNNPTDLNSRTPLYVRMGKMGSAGTDAVSIYLDDFLLAWTPTATFPLGP